MLQRLQVIGLGLFLSSVESRHVNVLDQSTTFRFNLCPAGLETVKTQHDGTIKVLVVSGLGEKNKSF